MPTTNYKAATVDINANYEPIQAGDPLAAATGCKVAGADLNTLYAPASVGTPSAATTNYRQGGTEISPRFAAPGTRSGGGGGACVEVSMYLSVGSLAADVLPGQIIECAGYNPVSVHLREVKKCPVTMQYCYALTTTSGALLICSDTTPFTLRDGSTCYSPNMLDKEVLVLDGEQLAWEQVISNVFVGLRPVAHIFVDDGCYFAGQNPEHRIASHNSDKT